MVVSVEPYAAETADETADETAPYTSYTYTLLTWAWTDMGNYKAAIAAKNKC